jgi:hypothetical protein
MTSKPSLSILMATLCLAQVNAWSQRAAGQLEVTMSSEVRQYCHVVRFPKGWSIQHLDNSGQALFFNEQGDYEFRQVAPSEATFLVGGYTTMVEHRYDTTNWYKVDLSNPMAPVGPASLKDWEAGKVVPLTRISSFPRGARPTEHEEAEFNGFQFAKTGVLWIQYGFDTRLSPDRAWLVLQSRARNPDKHGPTNVFLDVFNTATGQKLLTIQGVYSNHVGSTVLSIDPDGYLNGTAWPTERYFLVPLGAHKERCLVCEFGGHIKRD